MEKNPVIIISAKDVSNHFARPADKKYNNYNENYLDSDPWTIAKCEGFSPYAWNGYEPEALKFFINL